MYVWNGPRVVVGVGDLFSLLVQASAIFYEVKADKDCPTTWGWRKCSEEGQVYDGDGSGYRGKCRDESDQGGEEGGVGLLKTSSNIVGRLLRHQHRFGLTSTDYY